MLALHFYPLTLVGISVQHLHVGPSFSCFRVPWPHHGLPFWGAFDPKPWYRTAWHLLFSNLLPLVWVVLLHPLSLSLMFDSLLLLNIPNLLVYYAIAFRCLGLTRFAYCKRSFQSIETHYALHGCFCTFQTKKLVNSWSFWPHYLAVLGLKTHCFDFLKVWLEHTSIMGVCFNLYGSISAQSWLL